EAAIEKLRCFTAFYRYNEANELEYGFAIESSYQLKGTSSGVFNSYNPSPISSQPVANWLSIYNPGDKTFDATVKIYSQQGLELPEKNIAISQLQPGERRDFPLGHPEGFAVGLYRI